MLLTAGERISNALVAMAIDSLGAQARSVHRVAGRRDHHRHPRQRQDHRRHPRPAAAGARRGLDRAGRRLPGRQPGQQGRHHARPRRVGHHRRRAGRRAEGRRLRDLHRCRRDLHRRPADRAQRPAAGHRHLRGDARDGRMRGQGADAALCGIRPPLRRSDSCPVVVLGQAGHIRDRIDRGHTHGRRHPDRSRTRPQRGQGHRRRPARRSGLRRQGVPRGRRCRRQHRHGAAEHLQDRGRQDRHHLHLLARQRARRGGEADRAAGRDRLHPRCSTTTTSARCRWSVRACAAIPASPRGSARRSPGSG